MPACGVGHARRFSEQIHKANVDCAADRRAHKRQGACGFFHAEAAGQRRSQALGTGGQRLLGKLALGRTLQAIAQCGIADGGRGVLISQLARRLQCRSPSQPLLGLSVS